MIEPHHEVLNIRKQIVILMEEVEFKVLQSTLKLILNILMYYQEQNKWYLKRCLFAYFEATLDLSRSKFSCT